MMSLAHRLKAAQPNASNRGCQSCQWWDGVDKTTRELINDWIDAGHSLLQLYEILSTADDSNETPLPVSLTGWRYHMKHHKERCR